MTSYGAHVSLQTYGTADGRFDSLKLTADIDNSPRYLASTPAVYPRMHGHSGPEPPPSRMKQGISKGAQHVSEKRKTEVERARLRARRDADAPVTSFVIPRPKCPCREGSPSLADASTASAARSQSAACVGWLVGPCGSHIVFYRTRINCRMWKEKAKNRC